MLRSFLALLFAALLVPVAVPAPAAAAMTPLLGVHAQTEGSESRLEAVRAYEDIIGRDVAIVNIFKSKQHTLKSISEEQEVLDAGHTLMISWRATRGDEGHIPTRAAEIARGEHDAYLSTFAQGLDRLNGRVLVRWHWEMDQNEKSKQHIGTPDEYIAAWRHVHDLVSEIAPDVEWVWSPRARGVKDEVAACERRPNDQDCAVGAIDGWERTVCNDEKNADGSAPKPGDKGFDEDCTPGGPYFWPGSDYVDFIGGSAVPQNSTDGPGVMFDNAVAFARTMQRPLIVWVGVPENDTGWKPGFVEELQELSAGTWRTALGALVYYHSEGPGFEGKVRDYRINTSPASTEAMRELVCDPVFGPPPARCSSTGGGTGGDTGGGTGGGGTTPTPTPRSVLPPSGAIRVVGDWDGDGVDTPGWFKDGQWGMHDRSARNGHTTLLQYGRAGDKPVVGDWDGDGVDTVGVVRGNTFILRNVYRSGADDIVLAYGRSTDKPVVGDWDGNGTDTLGVVRGNTFILRNVYRSGADDIVLAYGRSTDKPVVGDWDGNGTDTLGVVRGNTFILRNVYRSGAKDIVLAYGRDTDLPVVGDWDGDGDVTLGVVRDGRWILRNEYRSGAKDLVFDY